jgi:hypothetical protein
MSIIDPEKSIDEILNEMFLYVVENEVRSKPHIAILSKKQIWWGCGRHFKDAPRHIEAGLMRNMGVKIPKKEAIEKAEMHYGYQALKYPWGDLNTITNRGMRKVLRDTLNGLNDIRIMLGRGYINKDGTLDTTQTQGISVYVIFLADAEFRGKQNRWISEQAQWVRFQIARNQETHYDILFEKKQQASEIVKLNRKLIHQLEYKELNPCIDRSLLPWDLQ